MSFTNGSVHTEDDHIMEFQSRWPYSRPNFLTLSENQGRYFVPEAPEALGLNSRLWLPEGKEGVDFLMLSDHNRSTAPFNTDRIGERKRMINGDMRSYYVADKLSVTLSWDDLPSRAYSDLEGWEAYEKNKDSVCMFTVDGFAGGLDILKWHNAHKGSMWAFFSFDNIPSANVHGEVALNGYGRVYEVMITDFEYEVSRRGAIFTAGFNKYALDLWNVSITLEEV